MKKMMKGKKMMMSKKEMGEMHGDKLAMVNKAMSKKTRRKK